MMTAKMTTSSTRPPAKRHVVIPKPIRNRKGPRPGIRDQAAAELLGVSGYQGRRRTLAEMDAAIALGAKR